MAAEAVVVEEVARNFGEAAEVVRKFNTGGISFLVGGLLIGGAVGFYFGKKYNSAKIRAEIFEESEEELRAHREGREVRAKVMRKKPPVEDIVEKKGYGRPTTPPVPAHEPRASRKGSRPSSPEEPYTIPQDVFMAHENPAYTQVTLTYYALDDVLCDDADKPVVDGAIMIGEDNLQFGSGSDDPDVVYVRNDKRRLEFEICRVSKSYEAEVLGHDHAEGS